MSSRLALTIGAVAAGLFGFALVAAPAQMLSGFGLGAPSEALTLSRDLGVTLLGLAVLNWMGRDASGAALRAILVGNIVVQLLEIIVNGYAVATSVLPASAAGGIALHLVLGVIFALPLMGRNAPRA